MRKPPDREPGPNHNRLLSLVARGSRTRSPPRVRSSARARSLAATTRARRSSCWMTPSLTNSGSSTSDERSALALTSACKVSTNWRMCGMRCSIGSSCRGAGGARSPVEFGNGPCPAGRPPRRRVRGDLLAPMRCGRCGRWGPIFAGATGANARNGGDCRTVAGGGGRDGGPRIGVRGRHIGTPLKGGRAVRGPAARAAGGSRGLGPPVAGWAGPPRLSALSRRRRKEAVRVDVELFERRSDRACAPITSLNVDT